MLSNAVQVTRKELSNGLTAILINDGMTVAEITRVLGIPKDTILKHMKMAGIELVEIFPLSASKLRKDGVIPITGRTPRIVPRIAIESLVRFIATPETDAIYKQLWDIADAVKAGDYITAGKIVNTNAKDMLEYSKAMTAALEEQMARAENAEAMLTHTQATVIQMSDNATSTAKLYSIPALKVPKLYPTLALAAWPWFEDKYGTHTKLKHFGPAARITMYLKEVHKLDDNILIKELVNVKGLQSQKERALYNKADLDRVDNSLKEIAAC